MGRFYSQRELIKIAIERGWTISEARGKGSHVLAMKEGERPFPIPKMLSTGVHASIKKRLEIKD